MHMNVLVPGILIFSMAFVLHAILSRLDVGWRRPSRLLLVFSFVFLVAWVAVFFVPRLPGVIALEPLDIPRWLHLVEFTSALLVCYFLFYMGVVDDSPTLTIVRMVWMRGDRGLDEALLKERFTDDLFLLPRLEYMVQKKMIRLAHGKYYLAEQGRRWLAGLAVIRLSMGRGKPE